MSPPFRRKLINNERDPVAYEGLEPPGTARQPAQDDSTVGPCENGINRNTEYSFAWQSSLVRTWAPHSSSRGMDNRLIGETLVLEMTSAVWTLFVESSTRR